MRTASISFSFRRILGVGVVLAISTAVACSKETEVASETLDPSAAERFETFSVSAPTPGAERVGAVGTNDSTRVAGAVMDMDPMLETSLVGKAMRKDLTEAFTRRGYMAADSTPDFRVAYYAGTGKVVDTRISQSKYQVNGDKITTKTYEYPAGTIVVDVVDAKSDSLVWRGTGLAKIPDDPDEYSKAIRSTIEEIVEQFPKSKH